MRSNIPRTSVANSSESRRGIPLSASVPDETLMSARLDLRGCGRSVERGQVRRQRLELRGRQGRVGGHDARADLQGARDGVPRYSRADVSQLRPRAVVAVVAKPVTGEA